MVRFLQVIGLGVALVVSIAVVSVATAPEAERAQSNYFPRGSLRADPTADIAAEQWYAETLAKMENPPKVPESAGPMAQPAFYRPTEMLKSPEMYRALISYEREYLMAVRVFRGIGSDGAWVIANQIDFRPQGQNRSFARQLTNDEWMEIGQLITNANFWNERSQKISVATDCVNWVLEARQGPDYNVMSVACPTKPEQKKLLEFFPRIAGWFPY